MEEENTIKVKKSCAVCENWSTSLCTIAKHIDFANEIEFMLQSGKAGVRCDHFCIKEYLKA